MHVMGTRCVFGSSCEPRYCASDGVSTMSEVESHEDSFEAESDVLLEFFKEETECPLSPCVTIRFVIHGDIDGYSRLILNLVCNTNNRAETDLYMSSGRQQRSMECLAE